MAKAKKAKQTVQSDENEGLLSNIGFNAANKVYAEATKKKSVW
jgi:hypothetical protein